jgi:acyl-CoA dehydrogenase
MRSHPFLLKEVQAVHDSDERKGKVAFDDALFSHIGFIISNVIRSFWTGITCSRFLIVPGDKRTKYYYRQLVRMSSAFALISDVCIAVLGGSLKRRERISGRLADVLSNLYVITATLKHFEDQGSNQDDFIMLKWVCDEALFEIQIALKSIMKNLPVPVVGAFCNFITFPLTKPYQQADDHLIRKLARLTLEPGETRDRLSEGIFNSDDKDHATGRIEYAFDKVVMTAHLRKKCREAYKEGILENRDRSAYIEARDIKIITENEYELLLDADQAVQDAIKVDEFSFEGWQVKTP